jgi:hypothetical protein
MAMMIWRAKLSQSMPNYAGDPWGLTTNVCWPQALQPSAEPGFALYQVDNYYIPPAVAPNWYFDNPYPFYVTNGKTRPARRKRSVRFDNKVKRFFEDTGERNKMLFEEDLLDDVELQVAVLEAAPKLMVPNEAPDTKPTPTSIAQHPSATPIAKPRSTPTGNPSSDSHEAVAPKVTARYMARELG